MPENKHREARTFWAQSAVQAIPSPPPFMREKSINQLSYSTPQEGHKPQTLGTGTVLVSSPSPHGRHILSGLFQNTPEPWLTPLHSSLSWSDNARQFCLQDPHSAELSHDVVSHGCFYSPKQRLSSVSCSVVLNNYLLNNCSPLGGEVLPPGSYESSQDTFCKSWGVRGPKLIPAC